MPAHILHYPQPAYDMTSEDCAEEAAERLQDERDEYIAERAEELVRQRITDMDRVKEALGDFFSMGDGDRLESMLALFYVQFDAAQTDAGMADAANTLFRGLKPTAEGYIRDTATTDAGREYDRDQANTPRSHAEARQELAA